MTQRISGDRAARELQWINKRQKGGWLQNRLGENLGAKVKIHHLASGKGKLVISYNNADEFEGILERLNLSE